MRGRGLEEGQRLFKNLTDEGVKMNLAKLWVIQVLKLAKIYSTGFYSTPQCCIATNSQPASLGIQTARTNHHCAWEMQPAIEDHSSLAYFGNEI